MKDAPRLLARLQGLQTLPDARDFLALQVGGGRGLLPGLQELECPQQGEGT